MVVGWLKEHSMCGQEMEAVTTDNLWFAVMSGWVGPVECVDWTVVCEVEKNTLMESAYKCLQSGIIVLYRLFTVVCNT